MFSEVYIRRVIQEYFDKNARKFIIYPYGDNGIKVENILKYHFSIKPICVIDNSLSIFNSNVNNQSWLEENYQDDMFVILAVENEKTEYTIMLSLLKIMPRSKIINIAEKIRGMKRYLTSSGIEELASMIVSHNELIIEERKNVQKVFEDEIDKVGGYKERYEVLSEFRENLYHKVIGEDLSDLGRFANPFYVLKNGHYFDHHLKGYFAPMHFKRRGFGGKERTPVEQMCKMNEQLKMHGIRFIYVPLPCKLATYPELLFNSGEVAEDDLIIPQWRNMLHELSHNDIEIVDLYPVFQTQKKLGSKELFNMGHYITPYGANVVSDAISNYLKKTTSITYNNFNNIFNVERRKFNITSTIFFQEFDEECIFLNRKNIKRWVYNGEEFRSDICIIGNCNLQAYRSQGCDITSYLSYKLNYPVEYGGRYLPFCNTDSLERMPKSLLKNKKILIYVGFPSASFVRATRGYDIWSQSLIPKEVIE